MGLASVALGGFAVEGRAVGTAASEVWQTTNGFRSFSAFKRAVGPAGEGMQWHHVVEQTPGNIAQFGAEAIHNQGNLCDWIRRLINGCGFYSFKIIGSDMRVRDWLRTQSFEDQYKFGQQTLRDFGVNP